MQQSHHAELLWQIQGLLSPLLLIKVELNEPSPPLPNILNHISSEGFVKHSLVGGLPLWLMNRPALLSWAHTKDTLLCCWPYHSVRCKNPSTASGICSYLELIGKDDYILMFCSCKSLSVQKTEKDTADMQHVFVLVQCHDLSPVHIF